MDTLKYLSIIIKICFIYLKKKHKNHHIKRNDMTFREMWYINYIVWIAKMHFQHSKEWNKLIVVIKLIIYNGL